MANLKPQATLTSRKPILLFLYFFCVIAAFWMLKPLKTATVVKAFGPDYYPLIKQGVVFLIPFALTLYYLMTCFLSRQRMVFFFTGLFLLGNGLFWGLFQVSPNAAVQVAFYYYIDLYVTLMVTLFWTYLNDVYQANEAKRFYGFVGAGGLLGGIVGSSISGWASRILENHIILAATLFLFPILGFIYFLERGPGSKREELFRPVCEEKDKSMVRILTEGIRLVLRTRYLLCIVGIVGLYEIISTIVDYQFVVSVSESFSSPYQVAGFQGKVFFVAQFLALGVQLFLTTFVHRKCGILIGLLFLPVSLMLGSAVYMLVPTLLMMTFTIGSEASFAYSINQASKEILYVPLDSIVKYKGKAFIDMFVLRVAKTIGAAMLLTYTLWLRHHGFTSNFLMGLNLTVIAVWLLCIWYVGKAFAKKTNCKVVG